MINSLDEAIKHCEEVAEEYEQKLKDNPNAICYTSEFFECAECAKEHRQLAEWLRELKVYRKIISELSEAMHWYDECERCQGFREYSTYDFVDGVRNWVKQFEEVNADGDSNQDT